MFLRVNSFKQTAESELDSKMREMTRPINEKSTRSKMGSLLYSCSRVDSSDSLQHKSKTSHDTEPTKSGLVAYRFCRIDSRVSLGHFVSCRDSFSNRVEPLDQITPP